MAHVCVREEASADFGAWIRVFFDRLPIARESLLHQIISMIIAPGKGP